MSKNYILFTKYIQWSLDLVTLLVSRKTVTKSRVVTKSIAHAYGVSINSKFSLGTNSNIYLYVCISSYEQQYTILVPEAP